jgi:hypothetical protein
MVVGASLNCSIYYKNILNFWGRTSEKACSTNFALQVFSEVLEHKSGGQSCYASARKSGVRPKFIAASSA